MHANKSCWTNAGDPPKPIYFDGCRPPPSHRLGPYIYIYIYIYIAPLHILDARERAKAPSLCDPSEPFGSKPLSPPISDSNIRFLPFDRSPQSSAFRNRILYFDPWASALGAQRSCQPDLESRNLRQRTLLKLPMQKHSVFLFSFEKGDPNHEKSHRN